MTQDEIVKEFGSGLAAFIQMASEMHADKSKTKNDVLQLIVAYADRTTKKMETW